MMKKITLLMLLISAITFSHATIIVRDIVDFAITSDQTLDFDFNNDGTVEFTFSNTGGTVGGFFNSEDVNFITFGTMDTGEGWDVISRSLITQNLDKEFKGITNVNFL